MWASKNSGIDTSGSSNGDDDDVAAAPLSSPAEHLDDDGLVLIDPDAAPWNKLPKKQIKPTSDLLSVEFKRRWILPPYA